MLCALTSAIVVAVRVDSGALVRHSPARRTREVQSTPLNDPSLKDFRLISVPTIGGSSLYITGRTHLCSFGQRAGEG